MDFIINNYLWFGIAGVVLLMALIGFLAEKTNFIVNDNKPKKEKKSKKKEKQAEEMPVVEETPVMESQEPVANPDTTVTEPEVLNFGTGMENQEPELEAAPLTTDMWTTPDVEPEVAQPAETPVVTETGEDLTQPFGDVPVQPDVTESQEMNVSDSVQPETTPQETATNEEDIWKF